MRFATTLKFQGFVTTVLACAMAAACVACGSADGSDHPYLSQSDLSTTTSATAQAAPCTPGDVQECRQYFTAYGTTNCIPGFQICGDDAKWSECGQDHGDAGKK